MKLLNLIIGIILIAGGLIIFIKYGEYRRRKLLGGFTFKYITFCFGLVAIGLYLIACELAKIL